MLIFDCMADANFTGFSDGDYITLSLKPNRTGLFLVFCQVCHCGASDITKNNAYWDVVGFIEHNHGLNRRQRLCIPISNARDSVSGSVYSPMIMYEGQTYNFTFTNATGSTTDSQYGSNISVSALFLR